MEDFVNFKLAQKLKKKGFSKVTIGIRGTRICVGTYDTVEKRI